ncbi:MAG: hypothetical protein IT357_07965 [Gemmatimonadaceae bacterium]|nr:hypothetical protein [Gemmatimonadaceae bacterium]
MPIPDALLRFQRIHSDELTLSLYVLRRGRDGRERGDWPLMLLRAIGEAGRALGSAILPDEHDAFERCASQAIDALSAARVPLSANGLVCFVCAGGASFTAPVDDVRPTSATWGLGLALRDAWDHALSA